MPRSHTGDSHENSLPYVDHMAHDGEHLHSPLRLIVAPSSGVFEPEVGLQSGVVPIDAGQVVGHMVNASDRIAVTSPFAGELDTFLAWPNERLHKYEHVLSMRAAS